MSEHQIKTLICDDTVENGVRTASKLREMGIFAYTRCSDRDFIFNSIVNDRPDVIVVDLTLKNTDAIALMQKAKDIVSECPAFIITSEISNNFIERQVIESGASYFLVKPYDTEKLCSLIKSVVRRYYGYNFTDIEITVTEIIQGLGVPANIKGYYYLRTAILDALEDYSLMDCVTKKLYPFVAKQYGVTPSRVERAIRHAIEIAWNRGNAEMLNSFFGYPANTLRGRPTNSEFIALVTDKLRLRMKTGFVHAERKKFMNNISYS